MRIAHRFIGGKTNAQEQLVPEGRLRIAHRFIGGKNDSMEQLVPEGRLKQEARVGHTYVSNLMHCVFSTKHRQKLITPELETRLWPYWAALLARIT